MITIIEKPINLLNIHKSKKALYINIFVVYNERQQLNVRYRERKREREKEREREREEKSENA